MGKTKNLTPTKNGKRAHLVHSGGRKVLLLLTTCLNSNY